MSLKLIYGNMNYAAHGGINKTGSVIKSQIGYEKIKKSLMVHKNCMFEAINHVDTAQL